jgi:hypothetical protein
MYIITERNQLWYQMIAMDLDSPLAPASVLPLAQASVLQSFSAFWIISVKQ